MGLEVSSTPYTGMDLGMKGSANHEGVVEDLKMKANAYAPPNQSMSWSLNSIKGGS